jgi:hypothetical protein
MSDEEKPLLGPDPAFASRWFVDDPLAQGALKHASIVLLDELDEARGELDEVEPDLGDFGLLGIFPASIRSVLTPWLIERIHAATLLVGWKLAQPGTPIPPGCIAEELALELIRREAVAVLELQEAPATSVDATKGVYKVCVHEDLGEFFERQTSSDVALAVSYSIRAAEDSDTRLTKWFKPFFPGQIGGAVHPWFHEEPWGLQKRNEASRLEAVEPESPGEVERRAEGGFRVTIRIWHDDFLEGDEMFRMPGTWRYLLSAPSADAAAKAAAKKFPKGATLYTVYEGNEEIRLDHDDIARLSIDVQRVGLEQDFKEPSYFHIVGTMSDDLPSAELPTLAGYLVGLFPAAVVAAAQEEVYFAVSVRAENYEEAEADFDEAVTAFMDAKGLDGDPFTGYSSASGKRNTESLWREIVAERWRQLRR